MRHERSFLRINVGSVVSIFHHILNAQSGHLEHFISEGDALQASAASAFANTLIWSGSPSCLLVST